MEDCGVGCKYAAFWERRLAKEREEMSDYDWLAIGRRVRSGSAKVREATRKGDLCYGCTCRA